MIKIQKKKLRNWAIVFVIIFLIAVLLYSIYYINITKMEPVPPVIIPQVNLEVYERNNASNKIVWVVKDVNRKDLGWEEIEGVLVYKNNTTVRNCAKLPNKTYIRPGDLITVTAHWDGNAVFLLVYGPTYSPIDPTAPGALFAETSEEHY